LDPEKNEEEGQLSKTGNRIHFNPPVDSTSLWSFFNATYASKAVYHRFREYFDPEKNEHKGHLSTPGNHIHFDPSVDGLAPLFLPFQDLPAPCARRNGFDTGMFSFLSFRCFFALHGSGMVTLSVSLHINSRIHRKQLSLDSTPTGRHIAGNHHP
jgi:hypothetical protein